MMPDARRTWSSVLVLAAIAVFVVAGYLVAHHDNVPQAGKPLGYSPQVVESTHVSVSPPSDSPSSKRHPRARAVVAFLGDDYTAGTGASSRSARFSSLVSRALGLSERNFGVKGTGYAHAGAGAGAGAGDYLSRVAAIVATNPDVVVVSGGRNDVGDGPAALATRARELFSELRAKLPHAKLVAIAPIWGDSAPPAVLAEIGAGVKGAVTAVDGTYLDISDPLLGHPTWMADSAVPNDAGYVAIARAVQIALGPLALDARRSPSAPTSSTTAA